MPPPTITLSQRTDWLRRFAARNGCRLELDGTVGFGRPCVGIMAPTGAYPSYDEHGPALPTVVEPTERDTAAMRNRPFIPDAYHKGPFLAVLGTGEDAVEQLHAWCRHIDLHGGRIIIRRRSARELNQWRMTDNIMSLSLHGTTKAVITFDPPGTIRIDLDDYGREAVMQIVEDDPGQSGWRIDDAAATAAEVVAAGGDRAEVHDATLDGAAFAAGHADAGGNTARALEMRELAHDLKAEAATIEQETLT